MFGATNPLGLQPAKNWEESRPKEIHNGNLWGFQLGRTSILTCRNRDWNIEGGIWRRRKHTGISPAKLWDFTNGCSDPAMPNPCPNMPCLAHFGSLKLPFPLFGYGSIPTKIPFLGEWTSINPSYFDVNYRGTRVLTHCHISPICVMILRDTLLIPEAVSALHVWNSGDSIDYLPMAGFFSVQRCEAAGT